MKIRKKRIRHSLVCFGHFNSVVKLYALKAYPWMSSICKDCKSKFVSEVFCNYIREWSQD